MAFDVKAMLKSQSVATAGGVVIGMGVFLLIYMTIESLVRPIFNVVLADGMIVLNKENGISWNCGAFLSAIIIAAICVALGFFMIKSAGK